MPLKKDHFVTHAIFINRHKRIEELFLKKSNEHIFIVLCYHCEGADICIIKMEIVSLFLPSAGLMHIVNAAAEDNATPLLIAAQEGYPDIVDFLLRHGANADISVTVDDSQCVALQYAVYKGHAR